MIRLPCAELSESLGEPMAGSAPSESRILVVEQSGPWGRDALSESALAPSPPSWPLARRPPEPASRSCAARRAATATPGGTPGSPTSPRARSRTSRSPMRASCSSCPSTPARRSPSRSCLPARTPPAIPAARAAGCRCTARCVSPAPTSGTPRTWAATASPRRWRCCPPGSGSGASRRCRPRACSRPCATAASPCPTCAAAPAGPRSPRRPRPRPHAEGLDGLDDLELLGVDGDTVRLRGRDGRERVGHRPP